MVYDQDNDPYVQLWKEFDHRFSYLLPEDAAEMHRESADYGEQDGALLMALLDCHYWEVQIPTEFLDRVKSFYGNETGFCGVLDEMIERNKTL